ncbi:hypothetical protein [Streptomyces sp. NBC_01716]|uniref:hypothetical protein n=1 Tax=Streptomyces sp. NBC_01716 TaxID=2975917 RepID=UPI002E305CCE|nr:hypothetical protein [Streptomyces sp. NBC_01716]
MTTIAPREQVGYCIYVWHETTEAEVPDRITADYLEIAGQIISLGLVDLDDLDDVWRIAEVIAAWDTELGKRRNRSGYVALADAILTP